MPTLDDAVELLSALSDTELAVVCGEAPGPAVTCCRGTKTLSYSCALRKMLVEELDDVELAEPESSLGLLSDVVGLTAKPLYPSAEG